MRGIEGGGAVSRTLALAALMLAFAAQAGAGTDGSGGVAETTVGEQVVTWSPRVEYERLVLTVSGGGEILREEFGSGEKPRLSVVGVDGQRFSDGGYAYELRVVPKISPQMREEQSRARETGEAEAMAHRLRGRFAGPTVQSGHLVVLGGRFLVPGAETGPERESPAETPRAGPEAETTYRGSAVTASGEAVIRLPSSFTEVTESAGLTVQLTPVGGWSRLYVVEKSPERLVVRSAGDPDQEFDFLIQGMRKRGAGDSGERAAGRPEKGDE